MQNERIIKNSHISTVSYYQRVAKNSNIASPKRQFSILQTCILVGFLRRLNFSRVAEGIGISLSEFYSAYKQMLQMTGARNKKELIKLAKEMKIVAYLFNENGRMKKM